MLTTRWQPGPAARTGGPVLISVTDFQIHDWRDLPGVWRTGLRLRRSWPQMDGAVGMWLWASPLERRSGSISVWQSEAALRRFVRWPVHVAIMRTYRERGTLTSDSWEAERFVASDVRQEARRVLARDRLAPQRA
jgi:hypothetical protein